MSQDQMDFSFPPLERGPQIRSTFQDQMDFSFNPLEREVLLITSQDQTDFSSPLRTRKTWTQPVPPKT